jgi:hypothetical protein
LYGPNSAGKSCVDDAFSLISKVINGSSLQDVHRLAAKWLHSSSLMDKNATSGTTELLVELHFKSGVFNSAIYKNRFDIQQFLELSGGIFEWFDKAKWNLVLSLRGEIDGISSITLSAGGEEIFRVDIDLKDGPDVLTVTLKSLGSTFTALADKYAELFDKHDKDYKLDCHVDFAKPFSVSASGGSSDFERDLAGIINTFLSDLDEQIAVPFNLGADRTTISNSALSHIFSKRDYHDPASGGCLPPSYFEAPVFDLGLPLDSKFEFMKDLAKSRYLELFEKKNSKDEAGNAPDELPEHGPSSVLSAVSELAFSIASQVRGPRPSVAGPVYSFVNRCLGEHLFLDQGYQLVFEALEVKPATDIETAPLSAALMIGSLLDRTGRRMTFEDIGTGISCVVPVLVAVHSGNSFIQQPELHLHPALQSALGDVFAEAASVENAYHFIETHSEYILLRCLRRVRETSIGKHPAGSPLALKPEDLSVLYFEPQPDGCTKVKSIRVSTQGDFIDRWPRGFFEERGKELFDE